MIQRLITDRDVLSGSVASPIVLDEHTLLTPAARDRAVQKGLVIVERGAALPPDPRSASGGAGGGGQGCGHGCGHGCGCGHGTTHTPLTHPALASLPDGLHLVRVEGGRVVSALPAAGPGLMQPARGGSAP